LLLENYSKSPGPGLPGWRDDNGIESAAPIQILTVPYSNRRRKSLEWLRVMHNITVEE